MRAPLGWLREYAALPAELTGRQLAEGLVRAGLEVETVEAAGADVTGPLVVGTVLAYEVEEHSNGKAIRWCQVDVGDDAETARGSSAARTTSRWVTSRRGAARAPYWPGQFAISARKTYGHVSDGMICSARELGSAMSTPASSCCANPTHPGQDAADGAAPPRRRAGHRGHAGPRLLPVHPRTGPGVGPGPRRRPSPTRSPAPVPEPVEAGYPVRLEAAACPLFVALTVTGVRADRPSPRWLARRIQLAGMRPISLAVDITNYVMLETGQPIHGYDGDLLAGPIVVRHAESGEKLTTLDDVVRDAGARRPADHRRFGSDRPGRRDGRGDDRASPATTTVVIEAANFDAMTIARTSRRHKLSSEASRRFERGVDPAATYAAAHRVAQLLVELAGGALAARRPSSDPCLRCPRPPWRPICRPGCWGSTSTPDQAAGYLRSVGVDVEVERVHLHRQAAELAARPA